MSLALPKDGVAGDLALLRTLTDPLPGDALPSVQLAFAAAERLVSPDVLPLLEHTAAVGHVTAAYPWRDGLPLAATLARAREAGVMPTPQVTGRLMSEALGALAALHTHRAPDGNLFPLAHGAFRADSLWLGFDGRLQLSDAGFSMAQSMVEQPAWAARSPKADVAQAGVLMHVMLTGAMPQGGSGAAGHDPRSVNPTVPEQLAFLVMAATDPNPDNRPKDAAELKEQWDAAVGLLGGMSMHSSVSRWLCTIFPSNHPLVEAIRRVLAPLGAGNGLPINTGPILSNPRLAPIRDASSPRLAPIQDAPRAATPAPQVSGSGLTPVPANLPAPPVVSAPRLVPVPENLPAPPVVSAPRLVPVLDAVAAAPAVSAPRLVPVPDAVAAAPAVSAPRLVPVPDALAAAPAVSAPVLAPVLDPNAPVPTVSQARAFPSPVTGVSHPQLAPVSDAAPAPAPAASQDDAALEAAFLADVPATAPGVPAAAPASPATPIPASSATAPTPAAPMAAASLGAAPRLSATPALTPAGTPPPPSTPARRTQRRRAITGPAQPAVAAPTPVAAAAYAPAEDELDLAHDAPPPPRRGGPPPVAIAAVGMLLGGVAVVAVLRFRQPPPPPPAAPLAAVQPAPQPPPIQQPEPAPPPVAPPTKATGNKPKRPPRQATAATVTAEEDGELATLTLNVTPWATVWVDGKKVGRTPLQPLKLRPGKHIIKFENSDYKVSRTEKVDVRAGMYGELTVTFTPGG